MTAALDRNTPVGVVGAGTMGAGIAQVAATAGHPVLLHDANVEAVGRGAAMIKKHLDRAVEKNRLTATDRDAILTRITPCETIDALAPAGLVIEAIVEDLDVKRQTFATLERLIQTDAILASNTSSLSITAIAAGLERPERVAGMHFFNPAPLMKLVEVIRGLETSAGVAETLCATAAAWGKTPALARSTPGFIVNRVARSFYGEGLRALTENAASVATIDAVMRESGGFRMGPFELIDLIGVDVNLAVSQSVYEAYFQESRFKPSLIQQELVLAGRLGRKTGHGFYSYREGVERAAPATAEKVNAPKRITVPDKSSVARALVEPWRQAGIGVETGVAAESPLLVDDELVVALTDGRSATQTAAELGRPVVLFDLAIDYSDASRIALTPADQCTATELDKAVGLFQALGKSVSVIDDFPGMLVMRTVAMLANEAAEAVLEGVATPNAIDAAMKDGVNYPFGPLEWADRIGPPFVLRVLDNLLATYGEDRYRASALLRRRVYANQRVSEK